MSIRVLGSDDNFVEDKFYCTGKGAIGELTLDFPDKETAIEVIADLQKSFPNTQYKVIKDTIGLTKEYVDLLWENPKFIHLREIEDTFVNDGAFTDDVWGIR